MTVFKKRETLTQNLAYMALMAAINVVFVLLTTLVPFLLFVLVFILPLTSIVVSYFCKRKYYIIYAVSTIILCSLCTIWNISDTIFYVIPSIISGFLFGLFLDKKVDPILILLSTIIVQIVFSYIAIPVIKLIYERNIVDDFLTVFQLSKFPYPNYIKHMFIALLAIIQESISFMILKDEIEKFSIEMSGNENDYVYVSMISFALITSTIVLAFVFPELSYTFLFLGIIIMVYQVIKLLFNNKIWINISLIVSLVISIFSTLGLFQTFNKTNPLGFITSISFLVIVSIIYLLNYLLIKQKKDTIDSKE